MQTVGTHTLAGKLLQRRWTNQSCTALLASPPPELLTLITKRLEATSRGKKSGEPMECNTYGPCVAPKLSPLQQRQRNAPFDRGSCDRVSPQEILQRLCDGLGLDERVYLSARRRFDARVATMSAGLGSRLQALRAANVLLASRADAQQVVPVATLEAAAGITLQRQYVQGNWRVDERARWYKPAERARFSCDGCSGDVVPEFDFGGCWPLWTQFAPDELGFRCSRKWTADPGDQATAQARYRRGAHPLPCWQTCWHAINDTGRGVGHTRHGGTRGGGLLQPCTAACPRVEEATPAREWWSGWKAALREFEASSAEARSIAALRSAFGPMRDIDGMVANVF
jgi:hypothetical protein